MGDVRRWSVTYTKHIKQKRKVYQDGVLEIHSSTGTDKVLLYDDSEKLLDSRFLKSSDLVGCGETLTFGSYLVDIGDLDNNCNLQSGGKKTGDSSFSMESKNSDLGHPFAQENHPNVRHNIKKESEKSVLRNKMRPKHLPSMRHNIRKEGEKSGLGTCVAPMNFSSLKHNIKKENEQSGSGNKVAPENHSSMKDNLKKEIKNSDLGHNFAQENHPNVRHNIKKENEKSAPGNNVRPKHLPSMRHDIRKEWRALYTSQKTQKAKKYHDGMLRLVVGVLDRRQVSSLCIRHQCICSTVGCCHADDMMPKTMCGNNN